MCHIRRSGLRTHSGMDDPGFEFKAVVTDTLLSVWYVVIQDLVLYRLSCLGPLSFVYEQWKLTL